MLNAMPDGHAYCRCKSNLVTANLDEGPLIAQRKTSCTHALVTYTLHTLNGGMHDEITLGGTPPDLGAVAARRQSGKLRVWDNLRQLAAVSVGHQGIVLAVNDEHLPHMVTCC